MNIGPLTLVSSPGDNHKRCFVAVLVVGFQVVGFQEVRVADFDRITEHASPDTMAIPRFGIWLIGARGGVATTTIVGLSALC